MKTSVIISTYNYARFLPRCLESVLSQSVPADEIIVVDDGSTDETSDVMSRFPSVHYLRQQHAGKAAAFNRGFEASGGDLICHLDADDYWLPKKLEIVTRTLSAAHAGGVIHEAFYIDAADNRLYGNKRQTESRAGISCLSFRDVLLMCFLYRPPNAINGSLGVVNTLCVWKNAVADCFPLPLEIGLAVDGALLLSAARRGIVHISDKLSAYRHHGNNSFVGNPGSLQFQRQLFEWLLTMPGTKSNDVRKIAQALLLENNVSSAMNNSKEPLKSAYDATLLISKLLQLGLIPHWKHLGSPAACILHWRQLRNAWVKG